jgi:hypothetical protein
MKRIQTPFERLAAFRHEIIEVTRKRIAVRRLMPGALIRFRRMSSTGPNSQFVSVFIKHKGKAPVMKIWLYADIEELALEVSDDEVMAELDRQAAAFESE